MLHAGDYPIRWLGKTVVVAGSGPGLTIEASMHCCNNPAIAVNDAHILMPFAEVIYGADSEWWIHHQGVPDFEGERWSCLENTNPDAFLKKINTANRYGINLLYGTNQTSFCKDRRYLSYGNNSGFQAINLAMHFGARRIVLIGFNMDGDHFFGKHPLPLRNGDPGSFIKYFNAAAELRPHVEIINATPDSQLKCFPQMDLETALRT